MKKQLMAVAVGAALLKINLAAAAPFNSFDPRSMGMGGAGVADGNPGTASFFNPALLSVARERDDFSAEVPAGVRFYDPKDLYTGLNDFQDADLVGKLNNASTDADRLALVTQLKDDVKVGFPAVSEKPIQTEMGVATVIGIPSKTFGAALFLNGWASLAGVAHYTDQAALDNIVALCTAGSPECGAAATTFTPSSTVELRGIALREVGVTLSREFTLFDAPLAIGITPKFVTASTIDYVTTVDNASFSLSDILDNDDYKNEQENFNFDLGIARNFENGWRTGLVVKNAIAQEYDFMRRDPTTLIKAKTGTMKLNPQTRAGVSYRNDWLTAVLDVDLTENDPVGFEDKTRYVALGTELNAYDWAQLRLGYRADMVNSDRNIVSAGLGLSPFGAHLDMAVAGNAHEIGASIQLGYRF